MNLFFFKGKEEIELNMHLEEIEKNSSKVPDDNLTSAKRERIQVSVTNCSENGDDKKLGSHNGDENVSKNGSSSCDANLNVDSSCNVDDNTNSSSPRTLNSPKRGDKKVNLSNSSTDSKKLNNDSNG